MKKYILVDKLPTITWYLCEVSYYPDKGVDWVLSSGYIHLKSKALKFTNREKAQRIADIINSQFDEYGYSTNYKVEEI